MALTISTKAISMHLSILILIILFSGSVCAIGVSPSTMTITYEQGKTGSFQFFGENKNSEDAYVKFFVIGEMAEHIEIPEETSVIPGISKKTFYFNIKYPEFLTPGTHSAKLYIEETSSPEEFLKGGSGFGAKGAVIMPISVKVPYEGKYIELNFPSMRSITPGEMIYFTLDAHNYGGKDIEDLSGTFIITSPDSAEIVRIDTTSIDLLEPLETDELRGYWQAPLDAALGEYMINTEIEYGGEKPAKANQKFRVGDEFIDIIDARAANLISDGIGKFMIDIKSLWSQPISGVYADIIIFQNNEEIAVLKTSSMKVPALAKETLLGYWEIKGPIMEEYEAKIILHFADKTVEKILSFGPEKEAKLEKPIYPGGSKMILAIVSITILSIVVLVSVVLFLYMLLKKSKHSDKKPKAEKHAKRKTRKK